MAVEVGRVLCRDHLRRIGLGLLWSPIERKFTLTTSKYVRFSIVNDGIWSPNFLFNLNLRFCLDFGLEYSILKLINRGFLALPNLVGCQSEFSFNWQVFVIRIFDGNLMFQAVRDRSRKSWQRRKKRSFKATDVESWRSQAKCAVQSTRLLAIKVEFKGKQWVFKGKQCSFKADHGFTRSQLLWQAKGGF